MPRGPTNQNTDEMKLTKIYGKNVKGMTYSHALGPVSLITGANGAGKTAQVVALKLALTGALPPPPGKSDPVKSNAGIYRLAGNPEAAGELTVGAESDSGLKARLTFTRDEKGKVSLDGSCPSEMRCPATLFDGRNFFGFTNADQVKAIFNACPTLDLGAENIRRRLGEIDAKPAATCEAVKDEIEAQIASRFALEISVQSATAGLIDWLKAEGKRWKDEAARLSGAFQAFRTSVSAVTTRPRDVSADLSEARRKLGAMQTRADDVADRAIKRLPEINAEWARATAAIGFTGLVPLETVQASVDEVSSRLLNLPAVAEPADIADDLEELNGDLRQISAKLQENGEAAAAAAGKLAAIKEFDLCAKCRKKIVGPTEAVLDRLAGQRDGLSQDAAALENKIAAMVKADVEARKAYAEYTAAKASLSQSLERAKPWLAKLQELSVERDGLEQVLDGQPEKTDTDASDRAALETTIHNMAAAQEAFIRYRGDLAKRDELEGQLLVAQCRAETCKAALKLVVEEQERATESAFGTILESARAFTDGILPSPLEFHGGELGRRVSEIDRERGCEAPVGAWVPHDQLSDSEQRLTYAAFAVALARTAPIKLVLIDELATFVQPYKVVERMTELTAKGVIDQAILVCPGAPTWLNGLADRVCVIAV